jgi:hypothetical protein
VGFACQAANFPEPGEQTEVNVVVCAECFSLRKGFALIATTEVVHASWFCLYLSVSSLSKFRTRSVELYRFATIDLALNSLGIFKISASGDVVGKISPDCSEAFLEPRIQFVGGQTVSQRGFRWSIQAEWDDEDTCGECQGDVSGSRAA